MELVIGACDMTETFRLSVSSRLLASSDMRLATRGRDHIACRLPLDQVKCHFGQSWSAPSTPWPPRFRDERVTCCVQHAQGLELLASLSLLQCLPLIARRYCYVLRLFRGFESLLFMSWSCPYYLLLLVKYPTLRVSTVGLTCSQTGWCGCSDAKCLPHPSSDPRQS